MKFDPATSLQDSLHLDGTKGVNPAISDSATFAFKSGEAMTACFEGKGDGFLYSRHWNPTNVELCNSLAAMEGTEKAWVTGSGMAAITSTILQICKSGDHLIASRTAYGGTYAFMLNWLPKYNIEVSFVDITNLDEVKACIQDNTKMIYTETMTNPMLQVADIPELRSIADAANILLVIDNTFTPMIVSPKLHGAHIVVYSMTKFINGKNDATAGAICGDAEFIDALIDVNDGTAMLLGPVLDTMRAASIYKNLFTLHIRMKQHSKNAMYLANKFNEIGLAVNYVGLEDHPYHATMKKIMNEGYGFGGMISIDLEKAELASKFMSKMQDAGVGYLAVSLGYYKTLFSNSGKSTSSEIPEDEQKKMGMSEGLVRYSVGLDNDMERTFNIMMEQLKELKLIS